MTTKPRTATIKWPRPWDVPVLDEYEIRAFKALSTGTASEGQQKRALNVILHKLSRINQPAFWPESDSGTAFADGKRFVGLQVLGAVNMDIPSQGGRPGG